MDVIAEASMLISSVIDANFSPLKSCMIRHLAESCVSGEVVEWMRKLMGKGVREISMERENPNDLNPYYRRIKHDLKVLGQTLDLPFEVFSGFEVLELKDYYLKTSPFIDTPQILKSITFNSVGISPYDLQGILSYCSSLENLTLEKCNLIKKSPHGSNIGNIFENLVTLCIDLDLKEVKNVITLSSTLESCHHLKNLEINNQVNDDLGNHIVGVNDQNEDDCLPFPKHLFWQRRELCECIDHQLKTLYIRGFKGKEFEVEFVKYIIMNAGAMKRITIQFADNCLWDEVIATICLLSYPKASANLSIILKPGTEYMEIVGGSIKEWVSTL
ncbi:Leucine-rich repeat domain superfamily [Sesbania bispinosa]|nr:Leucine-rich repeat domain superfamily [Sesbania bispinosa]